MEKRSGIFLWWKLNADFYFVLMDSSSPSWLKNFWAERSALRGPGGVRSTRLHRRGVRCRSWLFGTDQVRHGRLSRKQFFLPCLVKKKSAKASVLIPPFRSWTHSPWLSAVPAHLCTNQPMTLKQKEIKLNQEGCLLSWEFVEILHSGCIAQWLAPSELSASGRLFFKINGDRRFICSFAIEYQSPKLPPSTPPKHWSLPVTDSLKFGGFSLNALCQHWEAGEEAEGKWETEKSLLPVGFLTISIQKCHLYLSFAQIAKQLAVVWVGTFTVIWKEAIHRFLTHCTPPSPHAPFPPRWRGKNQSAM